MLTSTTACRALQDPHPPLPETISPLLEDFLLKCFQKVSCHYSTACSVADTLCCTGACLNDTACFTVVGNASAPLTSGPGRNVRACLLAALTYAGPQCAP